MEWLLILLVAGGGAFAAKRWRDTAQRRRSTNEELEGVRRLADEDVTFFGEQLQGLGREVEGRELDEETRADYQAALDSYESAKRTVPDIRKADEISKITDTLSTGRYALACVRARVDGKPLPELKVACFFNPQHGPAEAEVLWTRPGHGTRRVPACSQDAARVADRREPEIRMVKIGARTMPYWAAGAAYQPYTSGYFATAAALTWAYQGQAYDPGGPSDFGVGGFHGSGTFDGGGYDGVGGGPGDGGGGYDGVGGF
jgi:hypothetical protein